MSKTRSNKLPLFSLPLLFPSFYSIDHYGLINAFVVRVGKKRERGRPRRAYLSPFSSALKQIIEPSYSTRAPTHSLSLPYFSKKGFLRSNPLSI